MGNREKKLFISVEKIHFIKLMVAKENEKNKQMIYLVRFIGKIYY
jgi:hypothetical protein